MRNPILFLIALLLPLVAAHSQAIPRTHGPGDQNWDTRFAPAASGGLGLQGFVEAIAELPNGDLIVTGRFENAGGDPNADFIARWDGTAWHALGTGLDHRGLALAVAPNGDVFVCGYFASAGGVANTQGVARWDGTAWHALGTGVDMTGPVLTNILNTMVILPNGDLIIGGNFSNVSGNPMANSLARWNGTTWSSFAAPLNSAYIRDMAVAPNGDVLACGTINFGTGLPLQPFFARWDGTLWQNILLNTNDFVYTVEFAPNGDLLVGGNFLSVGGSTGIRYVARWDGSTWHSLGPDLNYAVSSLAGCPNGDILVGGFFFDAGGNPHADNIILWNGISWQNLGTGLLRLAGTYVNTIHVTSTGDYAVGGAFNTVGDGSVPMQNFAIYRNNRVGLPEASAPPTALRAYPNPAHNTLQVPLPAQFSGALTLLDATGRTIRTQNVTAGTAAATVDLHDVPAGLYVLRAGAAGQRVVVE